MRATLREGREKSKCETYQYLSTLEAIDDMMYAKAIGHRYIELLNENMDTIIILKDGEEIPSEEDREEEDE